MKISTSFSKKIPGEKEDSSLGIHMQIEAEPPPEIQEDRETLRHYILALFKECRERVEEAQTSSRRRALLGCDAQREELHPERDPHLTGDPHREPDMVHPRGRN